jgi:hypothetical protein
LTLFLIETGEDFIKNAVIAVVIKPIINPPNTD